MTDRGFDRQAVVAPQVVGQLDENALKYESIRYFERVGGGLRYDITIEKILFQGNTSAGHRVLIFDSLRSGWILSLNGQLQNCALDQVLYHEIMGHVPLVSHGNAESVLIVGGASGSMAREVLKHPVKSVVMVDIDGELIEICKRHLPGVHANCFSDPRFELKIGEASQFLREDARRFDLIALDVPDLTQEGPIDSIASSEFFELAKRRLSETGLVACQASVPFFGNESIVDRLERLFASLFAHHGAFGTISPLFPGGFQLFYWGSQNWRVDAVSEEVLRHRLEKLQLDTSFYDLQVHLGAIAFANGLLRLNRRRRHED